MLMDLCGSGTTRLKVNENTAYDKKWNTARCKPCLSVGCQIELHYHLFVLLSFPIDCDRIKPACIQHSSSVTVRVKNHKTNKSSQVNAHPSTMVIQRIWKNASNLPTNQESNQQPPQATTPHHSGSSDDSSGSWKTLSMHSNNGSVDSAVGTSAGGHKSSTISDAIGNWDAGKSSVRPPTKDVSSVTTVTATVVSMTRGQSRACAQCLAGVFNLYFSLHLCKPTFVSMKS